MRLKNWFYEKVHMLKHHTRVGQAYQEALVQLGRRLLRAGQWVLRHQVRACWRCGGRPGWVSTVTPQGLTCDCCEGYQGAHGIRLVSMPVDGIRLVSMPVDQPTYDMLKRQIEEGGGPPGFSIGGAARIRG